MDGGTKPHGWVHASPGKGAMSKGGRLRSYFTRRRKRVAVMPRLLGV